MHAVSTPHPKDNSNQGAKTLLKNEFYTTYRDTIKRIWVAVCIIYPVATLTSIALTNLLLLLIVLGWIFFREQLPPKVPRYLFYILALYIGWSLLSSITSTYGFTGKRWFEEYSTMLAIIPGLVLSNNIERLKKAYQIAGFVLVGIAIYSVYQYFFGWDIIRSRPLLNQFQNYHATGFQDFHLTFAGVIGLSSPVSAAVSEMLMAITVSLGGTVSILSSMGRSIMIGYVAVAVLFLIFGSRKLKLSGVVIILAMVLLPLTMYQSAGERFARGTGMSEAHVQQGDPTRIYIWKSAENMIKAYPIKGIGFGNWDTAFEHYKEPYDKYSTTAHAHNDLLYATVKFGIIGGGLLLLFWLLVLANGFAGLWRAKGEMRDIRLALFSAVFCILVGGLVQCYQTDAEDALILWMIVGAMIGLPNNSTRMNES